LGIGLLSIKSTNSIAVMLKAELNRMDSSKIFINI